MMPFNMATLRFPLMRVCVCVSLRSGELSVISFVSCFVCNEAMTVTLSCNR